MARAVPACRGFSWRQRRCAGLLAAGTGAARRGRRPSLRPISPNWSGYVVTGKPGTRYTSVTGTWREPTVSCGRRASGFATIAVGLGGYGRWLAGRRAGRHRRELQRVREAGLLRLVRHRALPSLWRPAHGLARRPHDGDCQHRAHRAPAARQGRARRRHGWLEVRARDLVGLAGEHRPAARRAERGRLLAARRLVGRVARRGAVELPLEVCSQASLANFGSVGMTGISAAADGVAGALNDPRWKVVRLRLVPGEGAPPQLPEGDAVLAEPGCRRDRRDAGGSNAGAGLVQRALVQSKVVGRTQRVSLSRPRRDRARPRL